MLIVRFTIRLKSYYDHQRRKLSWLLYEWESQAFFPVGRGIWFEPRAVLPLHSCDLLSVGDDANKVH